MRVHRVGRKIRNNAKRTVPTTKAAFVRMLARAPSRTAVIRERMKAIGPVAKMSAVQTGPKRRHDPGGARRLAKR